MKKLIFIIISGIFVNLLLNAQQNNERFYYYWGEKIFLTERVDKMYIQLSKNADKQRLFSFIQANEVVQLRGSDKKMLDLLENAYKTLNEIPIHYIMLEAKDGKEIPSRTLKEYRENPGVVSAQPVLEYRNGALQGLTDKFVIKLNPDTSFEQLQELASKYGCMIEGEVSAIKKQYSILISETSELNSMQMANLFYETGLFEFSTPNFVVFNTFYSNDTYFDQQWGLKNIGQNGGKFGVDIKAEQAWTITEGSPSIKIAVVDQGVDLTHPDLQSNLLPGYDATGNSTDGAPVFVGMTHGTNCAGIIGAIKDNRKGISGVAPGCKIIPINRAIPFGVDGTDWAIKSIRWAYQNGADVISNSWGGGSPYPPLTNIIDSAVTYGRGSKGCVVVFSAGNDASDVAYPANLPNVIAVGAIERCGFISERFSPCDPWCPTPCSPGSAFGPALDVVAPGTSIYTTDNCTTANDTVGVYNCCFFGTSAACPHVAGVAALVLSVNPDLTAEQVRYIIESTAQKINQYDSVSNPSGYIYTDSSERPRGTWNQNVGYGLVNAHAAVLEAIACATTPKYFTQEIVTDDRIVTSCNDLYIQDVTVTGNAKLNLHAVGKTTIESNFKVELGSELKIK